MFPLDRYLADDLRSTVNFCFAQCLALLGLRAGFWIRCGEEGNALFEKALHRLPNLVYKKNTPLSNLWLSVLRHVGVRQNKFADSRNVLTELGFK